MKKNSPFYSDEIDLIALLKIIWDGKIKILLITIISFIIGFEYNSRIPTNYFNSLTIKPAKNIEFIEIDNIQKLLKSNQSNQSNQFYLDRFINELEDYEEFLPTIKNTKKVQEHFSKLNIEDHEKELFKYAKLLEIKEDKEKYIINLEWDGLEEAQKILQDTLNLVTKNLDKKIHLELELLLKFKKKLILNNDRVRLDYLKEQSAIAKELNIIDNQIDNVNLSQSSVSLNISTADLAYYLRGYKAIDKEIELIENRDYQNLEFIQQEINAFKDLEINFVDYNVYLMDVSVKSLKDKKFISIISILLGLIVGTFYVLISNAFQSKKTN